MSDVMTHALRLYLVGDKYLRRVKVIDEEAERFRLRLERQFQGVAAQPPGSRASHEAGKPSSPKASIPNAVYLEVQADVRYWEDALVNGEPDEEGTLIPFRERDTWHPWIELAEGRVADWPRGMEADIHYKVCDAGEYWLTDRKGKRLAKWRGCYVPGAFLCHGDNGYGDYIILKVAKDGFIADWTPPEIREDDWRPLAQGIETEGGDAVAAPGEASQSGPKGIAHNPLQSKGD